MNPLTLLLTLAAIALFIYLTRDQAMFKPDKMYKVTFNDLTTKDHQVKETNIKGDFGKLLEKMQEQGHINSLCVLDEWSMSETAQA